MPPLADSFPPDQPPIFAVGEVLADAYEIRAVIGHGGMGQVYDAHDRNLGRRVAVKANWRDCPQSVRTEAQALAAVHHPSVVVVHALGTHDGVDYMVMEHVSGVTLARRLARLGSAAFTLRERLEILLSVAEGLAAIHGAGISHGDVKPENVLLSAAGRVVLTDLGMMRAAYERDEGLVAGTPSYMAPEIVSPRFGHAGWPLVDAYAFGVMAFLVLGGALPYVAESPLDVVELHAEAPIPRLSDVARVPRRLSELVAQLMAKDPHDRPQGMDAVAWQLRAALEGLARESGPIETPRTLAR